MTVKTKSARHSCNYNRALPKQAAFWSTQGDYNTGALIAGLIIAISFGLMFIHAAVML